MVVYVTLLMKREDITDVTKRPVCLKENYMTDRWKYSFSSQILSRGEDYYYSGFVHDLEKDGNTYTATVSGTDDYEVTIEMDEDNDVSYMECTCPYAEEHDTCKHMAAVLYDSFLRYFRCLYNCRDIV
jgi:uncharacterized Zn finger protein